LEFKKINTRNEIRNYSTLTLKQHSLTTLTLQTDDGEQHYKIPYLQSFTVSCKIIFLPY